MPLVFSKNISRDQLLLLWHITEDEQDLIGLARLDPIELAELESISLVKRRKEWLGTRMLVKLVSPGSELSFLPNGKPILLNGKHISISHNGDMGGVVVSGESVGLDIQDINDKLKKISLRFCSEQERMDASGSADELTYITILWSIKEAIFKCYGEHVDFDKHIRVLQFKVDDDVIRAEYNGLHGSRSFDLRHFYVQDRHVLVTM